MKMLLSFGWEGIQQSKMGLGLLQKDLSDVYSDVVMEVGRSTSESLSMRWRKKGVTQDTLTLPQKTYTSWLSSLRQSTVKIGSDFPSDLGAALRGYHGGIQKLG